MSPAADDRASKADSGIWILGTHIYGVLRRSLELQVTWITVIRLMMKPPNKTVVQTKRGRPPTAQDLVSAIRLPHKLTAAIDNWAAHNGATSRSEAIRRLVELG
jgi:hypothetical protein